MVYDFLGVGGLRVQSKSDKVSSQKSGIPLFWYSLWGFLIQCVLSFTHNILIIIGTSADMIFLLHKVTRGDRWYKEPIKLSVSQHLK